MVCRLQNPVSVGIDRGERSVAITAIVAAYNEEGTIAGVLEALTTSPLIDEVILVSDGSTDDTVAISRQFDVKTIALRDNHGKGYAMRVGVDYASHDILFFADGDMLNITEEHIADLVLPVLRDECDMNIGVRHRGPVLDFLHLKAHCGPVLSGIRVMNREVFESVPPQYQERFKIEAALNCFCSHAGLRQRNTVIRNLGHVIKESKRGMFDGLTSRWDMSREVFLLLFDLYVFETWRWNSPQHELPVAEFDLFE